MGWAVGHDSRWGGRDIGYGVVAFCDHPGCGKEIDRGLGHVCGEQPYGGERGCGLYFCGEHLNMTAIDGANQLCSRCYPRIRKPFEPTFDHPIWIAHKLKDPSWAEWRAKQTTEELDRLREKVGNTIMLDLTVIGYNATEEDAIP